MTDENDVRLTDAEREALDVMGMFPTSAGFARPADWERETEGRLVRAVESIIAARLTESMIEGRALELCASHQDRSPTRQPCAACSQQAVREAEAGPLLPAEKGGE